MFSLRTATAGKVTALATLALLGLAAAQPASAQTSVTKTLNFTSADNYDASNNFAAPYVFNVSAADLAGGAAVNNLNISIDFEKFDGEGPGSYGVNGGGTPFYNEIYFALENPNGVRTVLINSVSGVGSFNVGSTGFRGIITFSDGAAQVVNYDLDSPHAGTFKPSGTGDTSTPGAPGLLSNLFSSNGVGAWKLFVADTIGADHLGLYSATLRLNPGANGPAPVPEPSQTAAFGLGLLGLAGLVMTAKKRKGSASV